MRKRYTRWLWPLVLALAVAAFVIGLQRGEFVVVNQWAHTLCSSCIGLGR